MWAEIAGCGASFVPQGSDEENVAQLQSQAMRQALASLTAEDIGEVFAAPTSYRHDILGRVFGEGARTPPVHCLPPALGELHGATGAMLITAAVSSLQRGAHAVLVTVLSGTGHHTAVSLNVGTLARWQVQRSNVLMF
ncbi:MAG: hypothetical protein RMK49_14730 [Abditibacteriales bacterium]|nr:hypothetical protein [Abditibacteriales bacterium]